MLCFYQEGCRMIASHKLRKRNIYLNKLIAFQDTEPIKVVTGIRRCGKSSLLKLCLLYTSIDCLCLLAAFSSKTRGLGIQIVDSLVERCNMNILLI